MKISRIRTLILCLLTAAFALAPAVNAEEEAPAANIELGKKVYEVRCLLCHGAEGNGKGPVGIIRRSEKNGRVLEIAPRDLTMGVYRFRTTPTGCLPDDKDLENIVKNGITRSFMPSHEKLTSAEEIKAVAAYVKTFSSRFEEEDPCEQIAVSKPKWVGEASSVKKGEKIFTDMKCGECHGYAGRGDGPKSNELKDDWGQPIFPFNFATGDLKRGSTPENIYITFTSGLDGTGMPSYQDSLNEEDRWHLVSFTLKLMGKLNGHAKAH